MVPTVYATEYGGAFVPPLDAGDYYPHLPAPIIEHQKEEALVCHKHELLGYRDHEAVVVHCCDRLQKTIQEDYLAKLEETRLVLSKKTPKEIFDQVIPLYAKITIPMQNEN